MRRGDVELRGLYRDRRGIDEKFWTSLQRVSKPSKPIVHGLLCEGEGSLLPSL